MGTEIISGLTGITSALLAIILNNFLETRNKILASKREQFEKVFAPLEILSKINLLEFERFTKLGSQSGQERDFIEQSIWFPNLTEIKKVIMSNSHLLSEMPKEFLDLLDHINLWLFVYESKYTKKTHEGPVFAGPKGKKYPEGADEYIFRKANEYRKLLNK